mmetsp:Transcript_44534/g.43194  ORF Transcript_44534/g.43194 Transcript_44534/m.43194 type:complete len:89 (-) Transcript_44534:1017-1283(-)
MTLFIFLFFLRNDVTCVSVDLIYVKILLLYFLEFLHDESLLILEFLGELIFLSLYVFLDGNEVVSLLLLGLLFILQLSLLLFPNFLHH